ncbi:hypothetical protein C9I36_00490 [Pectobacterium punjabense]|nr:hypothetical protein C9I36_00490 [Pectobacterium punjabense]
MQFCAFAGAIAELISIPPFFSTIPVILQAACALAAFKYSSHRGPRPKGSTPWRCSKRQRFISQLELFRVEHRVKRYLTGGSR